jgi:hypothetical protein
MRGQNLSFFLVIRYSDVEASGGMVFRPGLGPTVDNRCMIRSENRQEKMWGRA